MRPPAVDYVHFLQVYQLANLYTDFESMACKKQI